MKYYVQINSSFTSYRSYEGLTQEQITSLLNAEGITSFTFIDENTFNNAVAELRK
jgi:hypothetical protein